MSVLAEKIGIDCGEKSVIIGNVRSHGPGPGEALCRRN